MKLLTLPILYYNIFLIFLSCTIYVDHILLFINCLVLSQ